MYNTYGIGTHRYLAMGNQVEGSRSVFMGDGMFGATARRVASKASGFDYASCYDAESMDLSEYKTYIAGMIDGFQVHPTRAGDMAAVELSDDVLAKMKEDPEYANEVLNDIYNEFNSSAASSLDTQAFSYTWLTDLMDQVQTERWLSPFDSTWGYDKFNSKAKNSLWSNMNSNATMASLLMKAQAKQAEMAQQAALQVQAAKLGTQKTGSSGQDSAAKAQKTE